ncbi:type II toxin-antitoxin system YoeB family toxin [Peptoniphilus equinus]|uniref:Endoribonuclease YoeB n=2 Tax=Peptoniphilus equinus TaxID=3016343 RepID=A0ABY7QVM6_9FIRM|nr:type II toxin-antitoxin system YoeB family toxin [Peptoniphilus equinus]
MEPGLSISNGNRKIKTLKRINALRKAIDRNGKFGMRKPEPLGFEVSGFWSRRINLDYRLSYRH